MAKTDVLKSATGAGTQALKSATGSEDARDKLGQEVHHLMSAVMERVGSSASNRVGSLTDKLTDFSQGGGGDKDGASSAKKAAGAKAGEKLAEGKSPIKAALSAGAEGLKEKVSGALGGSKGNKGGKKLKVTNIIEQIDVGAPLRVVYDQWTQFQDFSGFMKKVDSVNQKEDTELEFKAQVLWSHRTWKGEIIEQVPDKRIVWRSTGQKGRVDGAVTFHELGPDLTRVLVVLEYYPQGLFERTGNMWRAQGRRVRLELKHFRRHVMTDAVLHPDDIEGWRGEIHDGKVAVSDEDARRAEDEQGADDEGDEDYDNSEEDEYDDSEDDEYDEEESDEDESEDASDEDEESEEEADEDEDSEEDEYDDSEEDEYDDSEEDEYDDSEEDEYEDGAGDDDGDEAEEDAPPARRRGSSNKRSRVGAGRR